VKPIVKRMGAIRRFLVLSPDGAAGYLAWMISRIAPDARGQSGGLYKPKY